MVPEVHLDFMFMGREKSDRTLAFLVAKESGTKAVMCSVAPKQNQKQTFWLKERWHSRASSGVSWRP